MWWSHGDVGWGWALMVIAMVAFWAFVIWLFQEAISDTKTSPVRSAEEILAERLARGDIDDDEYRRRLEALRERDTAARR